MTDFVLPRRAMSRRAPALWRTLAALCGLMLLAPTPASAQASSFDVANAIEGVEAALDDFEDVYDAVAAAEFDLEALADALDYDFDAAVAFVRDEIAFEPYAGTLRGARGTLMAGAGNALDQALLLAGLLEIMGAEVRLSAADLAAEAAEALVLSATSPGRVEELGVDYEAVVDLFREIADDFGIAAEIPSVESLTPRAPSAADLAMADAATETILAALGQAGIVIGDGVAHQRLVDDARPYFWVTWRLSSADPWQAAHVATPGGLEPAFSNPSSLAEVPEALRHMVSIQVFAEYLDGGVLKTVAVSEPWQRPTASIIGVAIPVSIVPVGVADAADLVALADSLADVEAFTVTINGEAPAGAASFDLSGHVPAMLPEPDSAGSVGDLGAALGGLGGGLGGAGAPPPAPPAADDGGGPILTALFIEYGFTGPSDARVVRRAAFDRIGPAMRASGAPPEVVDLAPTEIAARLTSDRIVMVEAGRVPPAFAISAALDRIYGTSDGLLALLAQAGPDADPDFLADPDLTWGPADPTDHLALIAATHGGDAGSALAYRPAAALVELAEFPYAAAAGLPIRSYVDVVASPRLTLERSGDEWAVDIGAAIAAGVRETLAEQGSRATEPGTFNTFVAFAEAEAAPILVLTDEQQDQAASWNLAADVRARVLADLAAGNVVIIPETTADRTGWWRIDAVTGATLGMTDQGRGQSMIEYIETTVQQALDIYGHMKTVIEVAEKLKACQDQHGTLEQTGELFCCMAGVYTETWANVASGAAASQGGLAGSVFKQVLGVGMSFGGGETACGLLLGLD